MGAGKETTGAGGGEGGERRALGLNFHLSNPGPAHWLRARRPGSGCWRDQLLHSRGVRPAGRGAAVWGEEILGAKLHGVGAGGGCGLTPLRKTSGWDTRSIPTHALLPLHRYVFAPTSEAGDFTKMSLRPEYPERCRAGPNLPLLPLPGSLAVCGGAPILCNKASRALFREPERERQVSGVRGRRAEREGETGNSADLSTLPLLLCANPAGRKGAGLRSCQDFSAVCGSLFPNSFRSVQRLCFSWRFAGGADAQLAQRKIVCAFSVGPLESGRFEVERLLPPVSPLPSFYFKKIFGLFVYSSACISKKTVL